MRSFGDFAARLKRIGTTFIQCLDQVARCELVLA